jgi:hypothetical protein
MLDLASLCTSIHLYCIYTDNSLKYAVIERSLRASPDPVSRTTFFFFSMPNGYTSKISFTQLSDSIIEVIYCLGRKLCTQIMFSLLMNAHFCPQCNRRNLREAVSPSWGIT